MIEVTLTMETARIILTWIFRISVGCFYLSLLGTFLAVLGRDDQTAGLGSFCVILCALLIAISGGALLVGG